MSFGPARQMLNRCAGRASSSACGPQKAMMPLYYHPLYSGGLDTSAKFPVDRYVKVRDEVVSRQLPVEIRTSPAADRGSLLLAHETGFVDRFLRQELSDSERRRIGLTPWKPEIVNRTLALVGGSMAAMEYALATSNGVAGNMAGGTHHAFYDCGAGYCIVNDIAICAIHALQHGLQKVAVIDLDVHQGDGTALMMKDESRVFTASVHCGANFPFRKQESNWDWALDKGAGDDLYLQACRAAVGASMAFEPQLVIFQAGVDALADDALGHLNVTRKGMIRRNQLVFQATRNVPLIVLMGGGYSKPIERTVESCADLFGAAALEHARRLHSNL